MKKTYKNHKIITEGLKRLDNRDAWIITIDNINKNKKVSFVFAISGIERAASFENFNGIDLINLAFDTVEKEINKGLVKDPYFFSFRHREIVEVVNPEWWKGRKQIKLN
jgi:hypothetical protein